jgi:hypothetical protein
VGLVPVGLVLVQHRVRVGDVPIVPRALVRRRPAQPVPRVHARLAAVQAAEADGRDRPLHRQQRDQDDQQELAHRRGV